MDEDRILTSTMRSEDIEIDQSLRPKSMDEYIGQEKVKEQLKIFIQAAKNRGEALDHVLFYGPPGLGKTTLASIIAKIKEEARAWVKAGASKLQEFGIFRGFLRV